jgi:hypothetical protein
MEIRLSSDRSFMTICDIHFRMNLKYKFWVILEFVFKEILIKSQNFNIVRNDVGRATPMSCLLLHFLQAIQKPVNSETKCRILKI